MIFLHLEQGSDEWKDARIGIPTASRFSEIITPRTMKPSASAGNYVNELIAEWALGMSLDDTSSHWMERGEEMEESAADYYEFLHDVAAEKIGFVLRDDRMVGCSPDRFIGDDGGLEIKCPSAAVHVGHLLGSFGDEHRCQVQGAMWITGRRWWDLLSFHPSLPPALVRVERDEEFISALETAVNAFVARLLQAREFMVEKGYVKRERQAGSAA
jgi:hypothetical protein